MKRVMWILALCGPLVAGGLHAAGATDEENPGLPSAAQRREALLAAPAFRAAVHEQQALQQQAGQTRSGPQEWSLSASSARRRSTEPGLDRSSTQEWELGLERTVRLPGKRGAFDRLGQAQQDLADASLQLAWRAQERALLDALTAWWREQESRQAWTAQVATAQEQLRATQRQQTLGDAAQLEQVQAEAALRQAQAQQQAAQARWAAADEALRLRYPGLPRPGLSTLPDPALAVAEGGPELAPEAPPAEEAEALARSPELQWAEAQAELARAQAGTDDAERHPDPSVGLRYGRALSGQERVLGVVLSLPLGGEYRRAGAAASAQRAQAAAQARDEAERSARLQWRARHQALTSSHQQWQLQQQAAQRLTRAAEGVARAYTLGEGRLADVLAARRLAAEQALAARLSAVEAWSARWQWQVEMGRWTPR